MAGHSWHHSSCPPSVLGNEGIVFLLEANRRLGAMPGVDNRIVRQDVELFANRILESAQISIGKIAPPDTHPHQDVAAKNPQGGCPLKHIVDMPGAVSRRVEHVQSHSCGLVDVSLGQRHVGWRTQDFESEECRQVQNRIEELWRISLANHHGGVGPAFLKCGISGNMVTVPMGTDDGSRNETLLLEMGQNLLRLEPRVDNNGVAAPLE